jgi:hypothetical protein
MNARHLGIGAKSVIAGGGSSGGVIAVFAAYNKASSRTMKMAASHRNRTRTPGRQYGSLGEGSSVKMRGRRFRLPTDLPPLV